MATLQKSSSPKKTNTTKEKKLQKKELKTIDEVIDEASLESFPCSDPPAWIYEKNKKNREHPSG